MLPIGGTGPQPIPNYRAEEIVKQEEPYRLVNLDAATFDWVWRIVESKARLRYGNDWEREMFPDHMAVALKACIAFREAAGTLMVEPNGGTVGVKKMRRRVAKVPK